MANLPITSILAGLGAEEGFRTTLILNEKSLITGGAITPWGDADQAVVVTTNGKAKRSFNFYDTEPDWIDIPPENTGDIYKIHRDEHVGCRGWLAAENGVWVCDNVLATSPSWTQVLTPAQFQTATGEVLHAVRDIETSRHRDGYTYCQAQDVSGMIYVGCYTDSWAFTALEITSKTLPVAFKVRPDYYKYVLCAAGNSGAVYKSGDCAETFDLWYTLPNCIGPVRSIEIPMDGFGYSGDVYVSGPTSSAGQMFTSAWSPGNISWSLSNGQGWSYRQHIGNYLGLTVNGINKVVEAMDGSLTALEGWGAQVPRFFNSADRGETWAYNAQFLLNMTTMRHQSYVMLPDGTMIVGVEDELWKSSNNGILWTRLAWMKEGEDRQVNNIYSLCLNRYGDIIAGTSGYGAYDGGFWRSQDDGETWEFMQSVEADPDWANYVVEIIMTNAGYLAALTDIGTIYYSSTHGASWTFVDWIIKDDQGDGLDVVCHCMLHTPSEQVLVGHSYQRHDGAGDYWVVSRCTSFVHWLFYPDTFNWEGSLEYDWWLDECEGGTQRTITDIYALELGADRTTVVAVGDGPVKDCGDKLCSAMFWSTSSGAVGWWHGINDLSENGVQEWSSEMISLMNCKVAGPKIIKNPNSSSSEDVTPVIGGGYGAAFSYHSMAGSRQDANTIKILGTLGDIDGARVLSSATAGGAWTEKANMALLMPNVRQTALMLHPGNHDKMYLLNYGSSGSPGGMIQHSPTSGSSWQDKSGDWTDDWDLLTPYQGSIEVFFQ